MFKQISLYSNMLPPVRHVECWCGIHTLQTAVQSLWPSTISSFLYLLMMISMLVKTNVYSDQHFYVLENISLGMENRYKMVMN